MISSNTHNQKGFTLVELLFSTVFFSFILIVAMAGFIQINRAYQKGQTVKRVQEDTRNTLDHIVDSFSTAQEDVPVIFCSKDVGPTCAGNPDINRLCIGNTRYAWNIGPGDFTDSNLPSGSGRETYPAPSSSGTQNRDFSFLYDGLGASCTVDPIGRGNTLLLDPRVAVGAFNIEQLDSNQRVFRIELTLVSNQDDLLLNDTECDVTNGDQYCDTATLSTVVTLRN